MNEQNINPGIFGLGNPNNAYSQYFSGRSWLKMLTVERLVTANVTFEAGCRNNWHVHHKGGQILLVTAGRGWYQAYGEPPRSLKPGDVVNIPPEVKHWHGAAKDSSFPNKIIARTLGIELSTVKMHRANAFAKLGVHSPGELLKMAYEAGIVSSAASAAESSDAQAF